MIIGLALGLVLLGLSNIINQPTEGTIWQRIADPRVLVSNALEVAALFVFAELCGRPSEWFR